MSKKSSVASVVWSLWKQEDGVVISAELVLVMTIAVLATLVGLDSVSDSVNQELHDVAAAFGAISQSFNFHGMESCSACVSGSSFHDHEDDCDCVPLDSNVGHIRTPEKCEQGW
jgi:hypothetical protein